MATHDLRTDKSNPLFCRGDTYIDADGYEWYIVDIIYAEGKPRYSRVLVDSLAHQVITQGR